MNINIGEKIKNIRCAKMMTQQELAGEFITRNMLSRIENGFALPSIPTLVYISEKLGVPSGYLLADENEAFHYRKKAGMPDIMRAYTAGDWLICRDLCNSLGGIDYEIQYLISLSLYNEAKEKFNAGDLRRSAELFNWFKSEAEKVVYPINNLIGESDAYLLCIATVSTSLVADIETVSTPPVSSMSDSFCRYFAQLFYAVGNERAPFVFEQISSEGDDLYDAHLNSKYKMQLGRFTEAYHILKKLLSSDHVIPEPMLYFIFSDLEVCCRELSDYRGAYEYSADRTGLLEKFLG